MLETRELMEEFRGLLNLEVPERKLISFVFFGLPEIEKNLKLDPPLAQRVAMRYRLEPFNAESTEAYIKHRMRLAGSARTVFTPDAMQGVHRRASGTPRVINTLCDNALFEAFLARSQEIPASLIEQIADNLGLETGAAMASAPVVMPVAPVLPVAPPPVPPVAPVVPTFVAPPALPAAVRRDPELVTDGVVEGGMTVTATVSGGSVPVATPRALTAPISSSPSGTQLVVPRPSTQLVAPVVQPVVPGAAPIMPPAAPVAQPAPPAAAVPSPAVAIAGAAPAKPKAGVDLAEIDRYLEGLGKL
jgi:hypothetical protein